MAIADRPATSISHPLIDLALARGRTTLTTITTHGIPQIEIGCKRGYMLLRPGSTVVKTANVLPQEMLDACDYAGIIAVIDGKANGRNRRAHPAGWVVYTLAGPHLSVEPVAATA